MAPFAVIICTGCKHVHSVDLRNRTSSCPRCPDIADLRTRCRYWEGLDARDAQQAAGAIQAALDQGMSPDQAAEAVAKIAMPHQVPRHDSPMDAAAAKARALVNKSRRAEAVVLWLTRLVGATPHDDVIDALTRAGLDRPRAEKEIVRMLACDVIYEPRVGAYRILAD